MLNCTNINCFKVVSGDLHQCKIGPELMITAAGMTIKNNKKRFGGTEQEFHKLSMNERTVLRNNNWKHLCMNKPLCFQTHKRM